MFTPIGNKRKFLKIISMVGIIFLSMEIFPCKAEERNFDSNKKNISVVDDGIDFEMSTAAQTVGDFLSQQRIALTENDVVLPEKSAKIFSGSRILIERAKKITIKEGSGSFVMYALGGTIEQAIWSSKKVELDEDDITNPERTLPVKDGMNIQVTHVLIKEETQNQDIAFKTVTNEDDSLSWRIKKVTTPGQKGVREVKYRVTYNNGKEISRKILESNITKDPVDEVVTQGTMVKIGKTYTGVGSWYAFRGGLFAANPWLPMGSYVRVTNQDNGKQVIVKINDRGPFGNGRIIDLDKVAFAQIASLGAGVANVKVEAITN